MGKTGKKPITLDEFEAEMQRFIREQSLRLSLDNILSLINNNSGWREIGEGVYRATLSFEGEVNGRPYVTSYHLFLDGDDVKDLIRGTTLPSEPRISIYRGGDNPGLRIVTFKDSKITELYERLKNRRV